MTPGEKVIASWLKSKSWKLADFQQETIAAYLEGKSGLLNAPTGSGKTYGVFLPVLIDYINHNPDYKTKKGSRLQVLWITPLRALTKDLRRNLQKACDELEIPWQIGIRTGDVSAKEKAAQKKAMPEVLLITPESLHLLFATKNNTDLFKNLKVLIADEWHELLGTKRGVQTELAFCRLRHIQPTVRTWGMSATIGNLAQALQVLTGMNITKEQTVIIRSTIQKKIKVESILPDKVEKLPWAGYLGINLLDKVMPVVMASTTTLLFTNTRSQTEIWYRFILEKYPDMAGIMALHHGSLDRELRDWVEENLHLEKLKLVICTSSLDLGVDFHPVETVIQVGSPKSISRFLQRAGRSGHKPGATSKIYFVPTHSLELIEGVSLREGIQKNILEDRVPLVQCFDVLAQYLVTLAVGDGFEQEELAHEIKSTFCFQYMTMDEWQWVLGFITTGGPSLLAYDEFKRVEIEGDKFTVNNRKVAMRHRLSIGTIVSDAVLQVKYMGGKFLGTIEEDFISWMKPGVVFFFAGLNLEFVRVREMTVQVRKSKQKSGLIPRWMGGRVPLSSELSRFIRERLNDALTNDSPGPEMEKLQPILKLQSERSAIPNENEFLIERCHTKDGFHLFFFPFEGRLVHEGMASLLAYRISKIQPITFSMAMNDYGFELLSDTEINIQELLAAHDLFSTIHLLDDIQRSVNSTEMARRKFREISTIAGLLFQGYPGKFVKTKHLQASSSLLFDVISTHDPKNMLIKQAYQEALDQQLEETRLRKALERIHRQRILIKQTPSPTPFAFPILVDRLREQLSSEKLEDRVNKMIKQFEKEDAAQAKR
ncbi:MAG: Lhr-like helicase [Chitinophagaceae bacterium]|nr:Lhr-like helicase [Chitinophagaceae bacterium]